MENKEKSIALPLIALILSIAPIIAFYGVYIVGEVSIPQVLLLTIIGLNNRYSYVKVMGT